MPEGQGAVPRLHLLGAQPLKLLKANLALPVGLFSQSPKQHASFLSCVAFLICKFWNREPSFSPHPATFCSPVGSGTCCQSVNDVLVLCCCFGAVKPVMLTPGAEK